MCAAWVTATHLLKHTFHDADAAAAAAAAADAAAADDDDDGGGGGGGGGRHVSDAPANQLIEDDDLLDSPADDDADADAAAAAAAAAANASLEPTVPIDWVRSFYLDSFFFSLLLFLFF